MCAALPKSMKIFGGAKSLKIGDIKYKLLKLWRETKHIYDIPKPPFPPTVSSSKKQNI